MQSRRGVFWVEGLGFWGVWGLRFHGFRFRVRLDLTTPCEGSSRRDSWINPQRLPAAQESAHLADDEAIEQAGR